MEWVLFFINIIALSWLYFKQFIHKQKIMVDLPGGVFYTLSDTEKGRRRIVLCGYISNMFYQ